MSKSGSHETLAAIQSASTLSSSQTIDILMSNAWPSLITAHSDCLIPSKELTTLLAQPLDDLVRRTRPRYHFAMGGGTTPTFWEREPFMWEADSKRVTRFVSLGAFGVTPSTDKKQRVCVGLYELHDMTSYLLTVVLCFQHIIKTLDEYRTPFKCIRKSFLGTCRKGTQTFFRNIRGK